MEERKRLALLAKAIANFPGCWFKDGRDFDGNGAVLWSGEGSEIDGVDAFSYYNEDWEEKTYTMHVHNRLVKFAADHGLYWETQDPGTYLAYEI